MHKMLIGDEGALYIAPARPEETETQEQELSEPTSSPSDEKNEEKNTPSAEKKTED